MIPDFPKFTEIDINSYDQIKQLVQHLPTFTEFNFVNMFVWDVVQPILVSKLNDNLIVKFIDFHNNDYYYSIMGTNLIDETIHDIFLQSDFMGRIPELHTVPHTVIEHLKNPEKYSLEEDVDNHDYILSVPEIAEYSSDKFREKRNLANRFKKKNTDHEIRELDLSLHESVQQIDEVLVKWEGKIDKSNVDLIIEFAAIRKCLENASKLNIRCMATFVNGSVEGFTIFEHIDSRNVIMHFEKGNKHFNGIYEHQKQHLAKHLRDTGVELINYGQDMGNIGLRQSKQSYHPVKFHKKYTIRPRSVVEHLDRSKVMVQMATA